MLSLLCIQDLGVASLKVVNCDLGGFPKQEKRSLTH